MSSSRASLAGQSSTADAPVSAFWDLAATMAEVARFRVKRGGCLRKGTFQRGCAAGQMAPESENAQVSHAIGAHRAWAFRVVSVIGRRRGDVTTVSFFWRCRAPSNHHQQHPTSPIHPLPTAPLQVTTTLENNSKRIIFLIKREHSKRFGRTPPSSLGTG